MWFGSMDRESRCVAHCPVNGPALTLNHVVRQRTDVDHDLAQAARAS